MIFQYALNNFVKNYTHFLCFARRLCTGSAKRQDVSTPLRFAQHDKMRKAKYNKNISLSFSLFLQKKERWPKHLSPIKKLLIFTLYFYKIFCHVGIFFRFFKCCRCCRKVAHFTFWLACFFSVNMKCNAGYCKGFVCSFNNGFSA